MDLKTYLFSLPRVKRQDFAARCKSTTGHLQNVAYGYRVASAELSVLIEKQSDAKVTRQEMFPHSYADIWPELVIKSMEQQQGAHA